MGLRSNTKILKFHMVIKDWLINHTPSNLGSTSSLATTRFSAVISRALFKYPCNSKDNFFNNHGSVCYHKGNLCCSKGFPSNNKGFLSNSKGRLYHNKVTCNKRKFSPSNGCSESHNNRCSMLCISLNPYPRRANLYKPTEKFCSRKDSETN